MKRIPALALFILFYASSTFASDAWALRFNLPGAPLDICAQVIWTDQIVFHNGGLAPAVVRLSGTSYPLPPSFAPRQFTIDASGTESLEVAVGREWDPDGSFIGVAHLDLPDGVTVISRTVVKVLHGRAGCPLLAPIYFTDHGAVPQPVYPALDPPAVPRIHLGADLPGIPARTNVTIYNGGNGPATVLVELRHSCRDTLMDSRTVNVDPNSVASVYGLHYEPFVCDPGSPAQETAVYVRVVSDQPSLSWASSLANDVTLPRVNLTGLP